MNLENLLIEMTKNLETEPYNQSINTIEEARVFNYTLYSEVGEEVRSLNLSAKESVYAVSALVARKKEIFGKSRLALAEKFTHYYLSNKLTPIKEFISKDVQVKRNNLKSKIEKELKGSEIEYINEVTSSVDGSFETFIRTSDSKIIDICTIIASGYNIQKLHYRALVKTRKIKK